MDFAMIGKRKLVFQLTMRASRNVPKRFVDFFCHYTFFRK